MLRRSVTLALAAAATAVSAAACSGKSDGTDSTSETPTSTSTDEGDDDFAVADAVPMSLIGPEFLASLDQNLTPAVARGQFAPVDQDDDHAVTESILEASGRAAGEMKALLGGVQTLFGQLFGQDGFFKGEPVKFREGETERLFATGSTKAGAVRFIAVSLQGESAEYRYRVDLYSDKKAAGDATQLARTSVEFSPVADTDADADANVHLEHAQPIGKNGSGGTQRISATYRLSKPKILATFGYEAAPTTTPVMTVVEFAVAKDSSSASVAGGYVWGNVPPPTDGQVPAFYAQKSGDTEVFAARTRLTSKAESAQLGAFVPAAAMKAIGYEPDHAIFDDFPYSKSMAEFLRRIVREEDISQGFCATAGQAFRDQFTPETMPASVASAPNDLCASGTATNAQVEAIIADTCEAGVEISVPVIGAGGATEQKTLCDLHFEAGLLANPQLLYVKDGKRLLVQPGESPLPEHAKLTTEVNALALPSLSRLGSPKWSAVPARAKTAFDNAEPGN